MHVSLAFLVLVLSWKVVRCCRDAIKVDTANVSGKLMSFNKLLDLKMKLWIKSGEHVLTSKIKR